MRNTFEALRKGVRRLAGVALATVVLGGAMAASQPAEAQALRVGIVPIAPYGGTPPGGYFFDLMSAVAAHADLEIVFQPMPFGELAPALAAGTIDIVAGPAGAFAAARAAGIDFTGPTLIIQEALIVPVADTGTYTTMAELAGKPVGVIAGTTAYISALNAAGVSDVKTYTVPADAVAAMLRGEIQAFIQSRPQFAYAQQAQGLFPEVRIVDTYEPVHTTYSALASRRADELVGPLHAALEALKADGTLDSIAAKWRLPAPPI